MIYPNSPDMIYESKMSTVEIVESQDVLKHEYKKTVSMIYTAW